MCYVVCNLFTTFHFVGIRLHYKGLIEDDYLGFYINKVGIKECLVDKDLLSMVDLYAEVEEIGYVEVDQLCFRDMTNQFRKNLDDNILLSIVSGMKAKE